MTATAPLAAESRSSRPSQLWALVRPHLPALLFIAVMACAYWHHIGNWLIDDDEEGYLYAAWRISLGELPYRDFLTPQLPAFLFPGGLLLALFGPHAVVLRAWSALLMLVAGLATYLAGRRLYGPVAGYTALVVLLLQDDIFPLARAWRPEATMLAFAAVALYVFVRADTTANRRGYALAGAVFACALLAKLFGFLPWAGALAYLAADGITGGRPVRQAAADVAALLLPGAVVVAVVMGGFQLLTPATYHAVLEHQLRQGAGMAWLDVARKTLDFYWRALSWHAPLLAFVPLGVYAAFKLAGRRGLVVPWVLPTVLAFFLLTRTLFSRHLVYLMPTLGLVFGAAVAWLVANLSLARRARACAAASIVAAVVAPFLFDAFDLYARSEVGTVRLGALVRTLAPEGTRIVADYPGIAFYGQRATTYTGAGLSEGAAESGQITGERLWQEMRAGDVTLVLVDEDTQNGQLKDLHDFDDWLGKVEADYRRLGKFYRYYQPLDVYRRNDLAPTGLGFGSLVLEAIASDRTQVAAGDTLQLTAVLRATSRPDLPYTAFLHLIGPGGETWATGDEFLTNALFRGSEEWEPGEVVAMPLVITVPNGATPGEYSLQFGLYDAASGERLTWSALDGTTGTAWNAATVIVGPPRSPPPAPTGRVLGVAGELELREVALPDEATAGTSFRVWTTWRALRPPRADYDLQLRIVDAGGALLGPEVQLRPGGDEWPPSRWRAGELVTVPAEVLLASTAPDGEAELTAAWLDGTASVGEAIPLGRLIVHALGPYSTTVPRIPRPVDAVLGEDLALLGSSLPESANAGAAVAFELYWRAAHEVPKAYTALVHVVDASGDIVAQADAPPTRPTTSWRPGEVIVDPRTIALPPDLPPATYTALVGLYDPADPDLARLSVTVDGASRADGRVPLGELAVQP